jgi:cyclopropane-fatty-acyl-phospholipid synthase
MNTAPELRESKRQTIAKDIPLVETNRQKDQLAYKIARGLAGVFNASQVSLAEAYINGLEVPDQILKALLNTYIPLIYQYLPSLMVPYEWLSEESDLLAEGSQELMEIQYNLPSGLFTTMLGEGELVYPKYTMALWDNGALNLEQAQRHMLDNVIEKAEIRDGDTILDLGCGWGSAANYILAKFPKASVTSLNLSHEQCEYIRRKTHDPQSHLSSKRFSLYEVDFNDASFETKFDKIIAIGLFEHIGNLTQSFQKLASSLKDDGKVLIHIITTSLSENITHPFINKYIFPNMRVWSFDAIPEVNKDLKTINRWYINGSNYSKTLHSWLRNFDQNQEQLKHLKYEADYTKFRRIWRLYLLLCIAYFDACDGKILGNGQYLMVHT